MPPKKGRRSQTPRGPPEKEYVLLTLDDIKAREQKYSNRLSDLRVCLKFIDEAIAQVEELDEAQLIEDKWQDFITCNPLPKAYLPPDVRLFFEKLKFFQGKSIQANIDWILAIDERSVLSQNIFREDKTRACLKDKIKPEFGCEYNERITDALNVIRRIEYFLDNDVEVAKCSDSVLLDIRELKKVTQNHIADFFDRYTYRILCSEEAYMNSIDGISSEYCFSVNNFQVHIWCLKNVPIRFSHLEYIMLSEAKELLKGYKDLPENMVEVRITPEEAIFVEITELCSEDLAFFKFYEPRLVADFHEIKLRLHIPSTMLRQNLSIRAIHMNFDHLSENAKSYFQEVTVPVDNLNAGIQDLHECLCNEWLMQLEIQGRMRNEMVEKRLDYEEKLRLFEEEEANKGKRKKQEEEDGKKSKQPKILRPTKEPPLIGPDVFPDVYEDFLEEEQRQYENFINVIYNPESLGLDRDEINLKRFFILGGIYQLQYVEKPLHFDFDHDGFNMTWHHNDSKLVVYNDLYIPPTPRYLSRRTTRLMSHMSLRRMTRFTTGPQQQKESTDPECPWFVLTFKLPEYLCNWGEPIACHYETITKVIEEKHEEPPFTQEISKKSKGPKKTASIVSLTTSPASTEPAADKDLQSTKASEYYPFLTPYTGEVGTSIFKLRRLSASPRLSQGNFFRSSLSLRISQGNIHRQARDLDGTLNIADFPLTTLLNKAQIRHMERHCLPRIISSFKFPKEVREEELEAYRNRPKGKGGTLLRKAANTGDETGDKSSNRLFAFNDMQSNPERMFVVYKPEEPIRIISHLHDDDSPADLITEPETFLELIRILNSIKHKYRFRIRRTLDLKTFKSKVKFENKRLKQQRAKKTDKRALLGSISVDKNKLKPDEVKKSSLNENDNEESKHKDSKVEIVEPAADQKAKDLPSHKHGTVFKLQPEKSIEKEPDTVTYTHWTTRHILSSEYDKQKRTIVIQTDRLGFIGFAFKRYEHFPFKYWSLEPSETDPENEVVFTLDTQYVRCVLYCTPNGIRGHVTEPTKKFVRNPKMYLTIDKPIRDYKEFKKIFKDNYLNIFADHDACYYIENGYFSEKHLATEMHTYCCMAVHSTQMKFNFSQWNRLAKRRDIILKFVQYKDLPENMVEVRITPEEAFFVEITELCSDDLDVIKLYYTTTWRNIGTYTDLHHLINSMYLAATDLRCMNPKLVSCIRDLLNEIRPLSFS